MAMELFRRMFSGKSDKYAPPMGVEGYMPGFRHAYATFSKEAAQLERLMRYEKNWRAFFGLNLSSPGNNAEKKEKSTEARINYVQITVLRNLAFAFSKPWQLTLDHPPVENENGDLPNAEKEQRAKLAEMVRFTDDVINKDNPGDNMRLEGALFCGVVGDTVLVASPVLPESLSVKYLESGVPVADLQDALIQVRAINPMFCHPEFAADGITLSRLVIRYPTVFNNSTQMVGNTSVAGVFEQDITKEKIIEKIYNTEGKELNSKEMPNPIGRVYAVWIKNIVSPGPFGIDDVSYIRGIVEEFNDKLVDISDIIDYHTAPTTLVFGARVGNIEKGANKVWSGLPEKARVENLKLDGDLPAMNTFTENLRRMIKETTGVNAAALGEDLAISNTSGVALHMRFYSMLAIAELKWASWKPHVANLSEIILMWGQYLKQITIPAGIMRKYRRALVINFSSNLPKDELLELQKNAEAVKGGMRSLKKALANMGSRDPDGELREIEDTLTTYPKVAQLLGLEQNPAEKPANGKVDSGDGTDTVGSTGRNLSGIRNAVEANPT